jgi:two-component system, NtrC family, sensor kinase
MGKRRAAVREADNGVKDAALVSELNEAREQLAATSEILRTIAESPAGLDAVLSTIAKHAARLCQAVDASVLLIQDGELVVRAHYGPIRITFTRLPLNRNWTSGRAAIDGKPVHVADYFSDEGDEFPEGKEQALLDGNRATLAVPLTTDEGAIGVMTIRRTEPSRFTESQISLLRTFADQAVIAIANARLFEAEQQRTYELADALEQQTSTAQILEVIASSPTDVQPVLDAVAESVGKLCDAHDAVIMLVEDDILVVRAHYGPIPVDFKSLPVERRSVSGRSIIDGQSIHVTDLSIEKKEFPVGQELAQRMGHKSILASPLLRDDRAIGVITVRRDHVAPFSEKQIALVETFADQAVIAIENVRLFEEVQERTRELQESLEHQTATSEVLGVISRSPDQIQPVFDAIVATAQHLCESDDAHIFRLEDGAYKLVAHRNTDVAKKITRHLLENPIQPDQRGSVTVRAAKLMKPVHVPNTEADVEYDKGLLSLTGRRAVLAVPLIRENAAIGVITMQRPSDHPFSQKHIELVSTFADQAVIAINNVELFERAETRTRELSEALEHQTATSEVLSVISRSPTDAQPIFDAIAESGCRLCNGLFSTVYLYDGELLHIAATHNLTEDARRQLSRRYPCKPDRFQAGSRAIVDRKIIQVPDVSEDPNYSKDFARAGGWRSVLGVPMLRDGKPLGAIGIARSDPGPFSERQIQLINTFADQAVIALENVRLFEQVQSRTTELSDALSLQTATADVLQTISRSAFDLQTVLDTLAQSAAKLCEAEQACILRRYDDLFKWASSFGFPDELIAYAAEHPFKAGTDSAASRVAMTADVVHIPDVLADPDYLATDIQRLGKYRSMLAVPLLREGAPIGVFLVTRQEVRPFSERHINVITAFADQAVIAIENARLFGEVQARTEELRLSLDELRNAQNRLVQTEKLASLGQLTAGIAHEIKNPLNFVNNFSSLSSELVDELSGTLKTAELKGQIGAEVEELTEMLKGNLEKVVQHGKRADLIVKNMLLHSRQSAGDHRPVDVNALVDESLNLAYHGARAENREFNVTLLKDFDSEAGDVDLFPQEITRVLLNLISNGFYATNKRAGLERNDAYEPTLSAATKNLGDSVEITIHDNGTGIPPEVAERMFNPFFTTKPPGEGTGLGLSLSHDIIVKQHSGSIEVDTEQGVFTQFRILLPRNAASAPKVEGNN